MEQKERGDLICTSQDTLVGTKVPRGKFWREVPGGICTLDNKCIAFIVQGETNASNIPIAWKVYLPGHDVFYLPDIAAANAARMWLDKSLAIRWSNKESNLEI